MAQQLSWAELVKQAQQNRLKNYEGSYGDGTYIDGLPAQLQLADDGSIKGINYYGVQGRPGYNMSLAPNADGSVNQQWYKEDNSIPWGALALVAAPFAASMFGAGAGAGAAPAAGSTAGAAGTDFLSSIGIAPESVSAFTPATTADFASMGIGDLAGGEAALATGGGLAGTAASGGGATAPGWVSAEGGAGYSGGMAADAASGGGIMNSIASVLKNPLTQVGASVLSGAYSANQAKKAADAQKAAADTAIGEQRRQFDQMRTDLSPWRDRGTLAANRMAVMMGLAGNASDPLYNKGYQVAPKYQGGALAQPAQNAFAQILGMKRG